MRLLEQPTVDPLHVAANLVSIGAIAFTWFSFLVSFVPIFLAAAASFIALAYYGLAVYNDPTVKKWRHQRRLRQIAYLKARVVGLEAKQIFDEAIETHLPTQTLPDVIKSNLQH